ncbi:MAG: hypothetical protein IPO13_14960 [Rhodocyclaceae bacterium]|nr:hypothetical protein [Rhodocyclaceae bacterium]
MTDRSSVESTKLSVSTSVGIIASVLWVAAFIALLYLKSDTLDSLKVNEWGDFFAGAVAPLAFLWLVLGYIQQGEELRLNTEALRTQQQELANQVRETALLVDGTTRHAAAVELEAYRNARKAVDDHQPLIHLLIMRRVSSEKGLRFGLTCVNKGAHMSVLRITSPTARWTQTSHVRQIFDPDQEFTILLSCTDEATTELTSIRELTIDYQDGLSVTRSQTYAISGNNRMVLTRPHEYLPGELPFAGRFFDAAKIEVGSKVGK